MTETCLGKEMRVWSYSPELGWTTRQKKLSLTLTSQSILHT